jgi:TetR/AcrR family transcriptional repressor of lmrAB and yxaGH operons
MGARTDTRDQMIRATALLMAEKGYEATGLSQVLEAASAPRGSIYFHFPGGKEELALEALKYSIDRALRGVGKAIAKSTTVEDSVRRSARALARGLQDSHFRLGCPIATVALETSVSHESLRIVCGDFFRSWESLYSVRLQAEGYDDQRSARLASLIVTVLEGGLLLAKVSKSTRPLLDAGNQLADMLAMIVSRES